MLTVAKGWESLAGTGESVAVESALLNAAIWYERAGYQANASCLARLAVEPRRWRTDPRFDGLLSAFLQRLFLRVSYLESGLTRQPRGVSDIPSEELQRLASQAVTAQALADVARFFLPETKAGSSGLWVIPHWLGRASRRLVTPWI